MHDRCPLCGTERIGAIRSCRSCGFVFDARGAGRQTAAARRRHQARGLLALAFFVVVGLAGLSTQATPNLGSLTADAPDTEPTPSTGPLVAAAPLGALPGPSSAPQPATGPTATTTRAEVVRVIDGHTILVAVAGKRYQVRYLGIALLSKMGPRAMAANTDLVAGRTVILEADVTRTDGAGRLLRYVWVQHGRRWTLVNAELVQRGFATAATGGPDVKYAGQYVAAEDHARARHLGFWSHGPKAKPKPHQHKPDKPGKHHKPDGTHPGADRP